MNDALEYYKDNKNIFQISGFMPPITSSSHPYSEEDYFFLPRISSWGWGIWSDRWNSIDWELKDFNTFIKSKKEIEKFEKGGKDKLSVIIGAYSGFNDVWAIKCDYGRYKFNDAKVLYPGISKVKNIGSDGSGTHRENSNRFDVEIGDKVEKTFRFKKNATINPQVLSQFESIFKINRINKLITYWSFRLGIYKILKRIKEYLKNG